VEHVGLDDRFCKEVASEDELRNLMMKPKEGTREPE
jgi:hypothetical protein